MNETPKNSEDKSQPDPATGMTDSLTAGPEKDSYLSAIEKNSDIPLSPTILLYSVAAIFIVFLIWANVATLDEVTRGQGKIIPSSKTKSVQGVDKGQVSQLHVREGEKVVEGQKLISIKSTEARSNFLSNQARLLGLRAKLARLRAEVNGSDVITFPEIVLNKAQESAAEERLSFRQNKAQIQSRLEIVKNQITQRRQEISEIETQIRDLKEVIELSEQEVSMIKPLVESGAAPKVELIQLERAMKEKESELNRLRETLPRARAALNEASARRAEILTDARQKAQTDLTETLVEIRSIQEKMAAFEDIQDRTTLKSPINGIVQSINENLGGVVEPGETLVEIVPKEDSLLVEAKVNPKDIAFLHPGQQATIKITAYDFSVYGGLQAKLVDISPDSITDKQGNTFYRVRLRTNETVLSYRGRELPIIPGMVANVDILTGEKTVMEYLMKPFFKTVNNALNER